MPQDDTGRLERHRGPGDRRARRRIGFGTDLMGVLEDEQLGGLRVQVEVEGVLRTLQAPPR